MGGEDKSLEMRVDPRPGSIDESLGGIGRIIAVVSGKGGVGKSVISAVMALQLVRSGKRVGMLDLDFHSPCLHIILGAGGERPVEDRGLIPPVIHGVRLMSVVYFTGERALPLKGREISDALVEIMTVTRWGDLDFLIIDAPPGMGDELLDLVRLIRRAEFLIVTTPSPLAMSAVPKIRSVLSDAGGRILGVVLNMDRTGIHEGTYAGIIPFDSELERCIGDPERMMETRFSEALDKIVKSLTGALEFYKGKTCARE
jgi:ATP-binding protein involved in chromosome partitioning